MAFPRCSYVSPSSSGHVSVLKAGVIVPLFLILVLWHDECWAYLGLPHFKWDIENSTWSENYDWDHEETQKKNGDLWYLVWRQEDSAVLKYAENFHAEEEKE